MALFPTPTLAGRVRDGIADSGATLSYEDRRGQVALGDGYSFTYSRGMRPLIPVWDLSWVGTRDDLRVSHDFLVQQANNNSDFFYWLDPYAAEDSEPSRWWCSTFTLKNVKGNAWSLTARFVQR